MPQAQAQRRRRSASEDKYASIDSYPWDTDEEFQGGLTAILGNNTSSQSQSDELSLRARCFYYARKYNVDVDFDAYKSWRERRGRRASIIRSPTTRSVNGVPASTVTLPEPSSEPTQSLNSHLASTSTSSSDARIPQSHDHASSDAQTASAAPSSSEVEGGERESSEVTPQTAPYPPSFQQIVELIQTGRPIPGIKEIPDTVLEGGATASRRQQRRKPWEREGGQSAVASTGGSQQRSRAAG